ncbi:MAG TPA: STAS domain-containing protein [Solirubrobacteraceae bacterium]|nr:STAS domain-containing protein [Solirubrobacteraceae bacterium]
MNLADLHINRHDGVVVVRVLGEIDMSNASDLRGAIIEATPNDALGLVLDLAAVDYIDSAGIHLLYRLGDNLRSRGQTLRVVIPPNSPASDTLRLAGVRRHVDVVDELEEGVRAVAAGTAGGS